MPADSPDNSQDQKPRPREPLPFIPAGSRYSDLETHELWQLLDDMDDERAKARRRESFYISTIVYLMVAWFIFYGPHVLWHQPRMINPADALKDRDMTYLDLPPDALKQMKPKTPPKILSDKDRVAQTPDRKTLQHLKSMEPPPAPPPQPSPAEQAQLPAAPQPQPPPPHPQPDQSIVEAPKPQPAQQHPNFNQQPQSAGENLQHLAENAIPTRPGLNGGYGGNGVPHHEGLQAPVEILSDTTGVDMDDLMRWINKKFKPPVYESWGPLIPEEAQAPLLKRGETMIKITIAPDGRVIDMQLVNSTHDDALNRAAWGSITGVGQFAPTPKGMKDPNLVLLVTYMYNESNE